jgi:hypothetical protein
MKKRICILIIIISCICSTAIGDTHIGIQGTVLSEKDNKKNTVLFDFFHYDEKTTLITSSLTPDYIIQDSDECQDIYNTISILFGITPEMIDHFSERIEMICRAWMNTRYTELSEGVYTGTLFGKASSVCTTEYMLSDFTQFIKNHYNNDNASGKEKDVNTEICDMLLECFTCFTETLAEEYNPLVRMKSYDSGRYVTFDLFKQDQVILTLSLDNIKENEKRVLITHRKNNRYYFRDIYAQFDQGEFALLTRMYCGNSPYYENVSQKDLIICEHFCLTAGDLQCSITYDCENEKADKILSATGSISSEKLVADIFLQDSKSENIILSAIKDDAQPAEITSDPRKVLDDHNISDNNVYRIEFMSGLSLFLAETIPMLPVHSQKLLYQMLFNQ